MTYEDCVAKLSKSNRSKDDDNFNKKVAKLYAKSCCEDIKKRCAKNAKIRENWYGGDPVAWVDSKSILKTRIILP